MRCRVAQIVTLATTCLCAGTLAIYAQSSASTAALQIRSEAGCLQSSPPDEKQSSGPEISIAEVTFSGALEMAMADQDQVADSIRQQTHGRAREEVTNEALERARGGWLNHGYFKVQVSGEPRILTSNSASQRIALSVQLDEGPQYSLGEITFNHNRAISNLEALRRLFPIKDGDIFSREKVAKGLENLRKIYGELGYINFTSVPDTKFDEETKRISLDIDFDEGKQFYVSSVNILGLDEPAQEELLKDFPMKGSQIYNERLFERFLLRHASIFSASHRSDRSLNDQAGTVTFTFDFRPCLAD